MASTRTFATRSASASLAFNPIKPILRKKITSVSFPECCNNFKITWRFFPLSVPAPRQSPLCDSSSHTTWLWVDLRCWAQLLKWRMDIAAIHSRWIISSHFSLINHEIFSPLLRASPTTLPNRPPRQILRLLRANRREVSWKLCDDKFAANYRNNSSTPRAELHRNCSFSLKFCGILFWLWNFFKN